MPRPLREAVSFVIYRDKGQGEVLAVLRPRDDPELPNLWGLPAGSRRGDEPWEEAARRAGREKLGVELEMIRELTRGMGEQKDYILEMRLYETRILAGAPMVPQLYPGMTQYVAWRWARPEELKPAMEHGSLCCRLLLERQGIG